jgi:hypothetical protein
LEASAPSARLAGLPGPATESDPTLRLWVVYSVEVVALALLRIPHDLGLFMFAFGDRGSWLVVQYLTAHGYRPTIDFGYPYGLLPIMVGRIWFGLFGLTPVSFNLAMTTGGVVMAWGMARFAGAMRLGRAGQLLMMVALPIAIQSSLPSLSHLLEAVMLCLALAEHSRGNRSAALALTVAACFAKAALGYLYGFLLVTLVVADCWGDGRHDYSSDLPPRVKSRIDWIALRRALAPAAITAALLLTITGMVYGPRPLTASLLPLSGMKIYRTLHFGFFTPWSRTFWDPRGVPTANYFASVAPFWMGATIWLALAGGWAGWRLSLPDQSNRTRNEIILCCAILQTLFVLRFFGPPLSWTYYPYILVMGTAASSGLNRPSGMVVLTLTLVAFIAAIVSISMAAAEWKISSPSPTAADLWADAGESAEWANVMRLIAGHRTVAVGVAGGASILFADFEKPIGAYLVRDEATPVEVERTIERIQAADFVVRPASESIGDPISFWPELTSTLNHLQVVWKGQVYQVCRPNKLIPNGATNR